MTRAGRRRACPFFSDRVRAIPRPNTDTLRTMDTNRALPLVAAALALFLGGCASPDTAKGAAKEGAQLQQAVEAPLADLNLVQEKIPVVLEAAVKAPYAL